MKAFLILEDGHVFQGKSVGSKKEVINEIVCNTSMAGYLGILTDPTYAGQAVVMTYPLIGNYGICYENIEPNRPWQCALIVKEIERNPSNFRCEDTLEAFMIKNDITGIEGVDTRAITKILRTKGTMNCMITTDENYNVEEILPKLKSYSVGDILKQLTTKEVIKYDGNGYKVACLDLGSNKNIIRSLESRDCQITLYPVDTKADVILADKPDGIMLTDGAGDPKECPEIIEEIKKLFATKTPMFAIGLGHQLLALASGFETEKMKYGHRGANHPIKDVKTGKVYISTQNHGYVVKESSIDHDIAEVSFVHVNDGTVEGLHYLGKNVQTVQFNTEECPGPLDTDYLFDEFINMMEVSK